MSKLVALVVLVCLFACAQAGPLDKLKNTLSKPFFPWKLGSCLHPKGVDQFDVNKFFSGLWYEQKSFGNYLYQADGICSTFESEVRPNGKIDILNYHYEPLIKRWINIQGKSNVKDVIQATLPIKYDFLGGLTTVTLPFEIVATDYDQYALVYSCQEAFGFKSEMSWVFTRDVASTESESTIKDAVVNAGLNFDDYLTQKETGCDRGKAPTI